MPGEQAEEEKIKKWKVMKKLFWGCRTLEILIGKNWWEQNKC